MLHEQEKEIGLKSAMEGMVGGLLDDRGMLTSSASSSYRDLLCDARRIQVGNTRSGHATDYG